jgi:hypothetical protein
VSTEVLHGASPRFKVKKPLTGPARGSSVVTRFVYAKATRRSAGTALIMPAIIDEEKARIPARLSRPKRKNLSREVY